MRDILEHAATLPDPPRIGRRVPELDQLPLDEQAVVKDVLESLLLKYQARRWEEARAAAATAPAKKAAPKRSAHATAR